MGEPGWGDEYKPEHAPVQPRRQRPWLTWMKATAKAISPYVAQALGLMVGAIMMKLIKDLGL